MEWAKKGAIALAGTDQAAAAVNFYTRALIEHPTSPDYLTQRAIAFSRLRPARHDLALHDAEYAVLLARKREKREKIQAAQQRRVVALYGLERYEEAKQVLDSMLKWRAKDDKKDKMEHDMWMAKISSKLKSAENSGHVFKEFPEIDILPEKAMKQIFQEQLTNDGDYKFSDEIDHTQAIPATKETTSKEVPATEEISTAKTEEPRITQPIRHDFYQNNDNLIVTFYAKKVDPSKVVCNLESNAVFLSFPHPEDRSNTFTYSVATTFATLDVSKSTYKVFGTKVELTLAKDEKDLKWPSLEATNNPAPAKLPSPYVTKSKQDEDWEKRAAEIVKKQPMEKTAAENGADNDNASDVDSDNGGDPVDGFFKKLYKDADDDTRKAMMKSFQESNGTALSTNWAEVSQGKVKVQRSKDDA